MPLDGSKEFEIVITDEQLGSMSVRENRILIKIYNTLKAEAISSGYRVTEYQELGRGETIARFTPPQNK